MLLSLATSGQRFLLIEVDFRKYAETLARVGKGCSMHVHACAPHLVCLCACVNGCVCVLQGTGGSIRGSGHVAQTQVIEGKEGRTCLCVRAHVCVCVCWGEPHVWLQVLCMSAGMTKV